jgi:hypothetical protein
MFEELIEHVDDCGRPARKYSLPGAPSVDPLDQPGLDANVDICGFLLHFWFLHPGRRSPFVRRLERKWGGFRHPCLIIPAKKLIGGRLCSSATGSKRNVCATAGDRSRALTDHQHAQPSDRVKTLAPQRPRPDPRPTGDRALAPRPVMPDIVGLMSSPEITTVNAVRWRLSIVDRRMKEAVELLREVAGTPGYSGPPFDVLERMADLIGQIREQVSAWSFEEQIRRASPHRRALDVLMANDRAWRQTTVR